MMGQSVNAGLPALIAFFVVLICGKPVIAWLAGLKMRQAINTDAPATHLSKQGTPTMGGILFALGVLVSLGVLSLLRLLPDGREAYPLLAVLAVFLTHLALGFFDDYLKATRGKSLGLKARQKLLGQLIIAAGFVAYLYCTDQPGVTRAISVWNGLILSLPQWLYYVYAALMLIGFSNFTNLTDGLDGLAAGLAALAFAGVSLAIYPGVAVLALFGWALVGAVLGFLVFNVNPARVFMGDTGSLALGASLAAMALLGKLDLPVFLFGLVFVVEGASVLIQVISYKTTGKRVFRMAPIHHHFELAGWRETEVVFKFWIAGAVSLLAGWLLSQYTSPWR